MLALRSAIDFIGAYAWSLLVNDVYFFLNIRSGFFCIIVISIALTFDVSFFLGSRFFFIALNEGVVVGSGISFSVLSKLIVLSEFLCIRFFDLLKNWSKIDKSGFSLSKDFFFFGDGVSRLPFNLNSDRLLQWGLSFSSLCYTISANLELLFSSDFAFNLARSICFMLCSLPNLL